MDSLELVDHLERLYKAGRTYEFIAQAHQVLARLPFAPRLAALTLRALVGSGLGGPARELLQFRPELKQDPATAEQIAILNNLPNGRIAWSECQPTYRRNEGALLRRRPHLREVISALPSHLAGTHLYRTSSGDCFLARRRPGALREWLCSLSANPEDENLALPARERLGPVAVVGLRAGPILQRLFAGTDKQFLTYSHPLYLVEPDVARFAAWLHVADHAALLDEERVHLFVGGGAVEELERQLKSDPLLPTPELCVNQSGQPDAGDVVTQATRRVVSARTREIAELERALAQRYRDRDEAYWAERFKKPGPVLGLTSRFTTMLQYSMRDTLEALRRFGWKTDMIIESKDHQQLSNIEVCRRILDQDPVLIIFIDHLRYENPCLPENLPLLTWIQDPMPNLLCPRAGASIGPFDFVCGHFLGRCTEEFGYPPDRFISTGIPVSETIFEADPPDDEALSRYACDVSFVSNASEPIDRYYRSEISRYPPEYRPMLDELYRRVRGILDRGEYLSLCEGAPRLVRSVARQMGIGLSVGQVDRLTNHFAYRLYDWGRRQQTLEWVAAWAKRTGRVFKIYGRGWENHPTLACFTAGVIEHGEPLRRANRASRLALQLIPSGFCHQRSYEVLAAGTLPLTRYCEDDFGGLPVKEYMRKLAAGEVQSGAARFFPRLQHIVFRTPAEFERLAERFLADETYKNEVSADLRAVVLRDHTYTVVMRRVLAHIEKLLKLQAESPGGAARRLVASDL
ncbi:MAG: glycosyltransferase [Phycisphaerae bacterium]